MRAYCGVLVDYSGSVDRGEAIGVVERLYERACLVRMCLGFFVIRSLTSLDVKKVSSDAKVVEHYFELLRRGRAGPSRITGGLERLFFALTREGARSLRFIVVTDGYEEEWRPSRRMEEYEEARRSIERIFFNLVLVKGDRDIFHNRGLFLGNLSHFLSLVTGMDRKLVLGMLSGLLTVGLWGSGSTQEYGKLWLSVVSSRRVLEKGYRCEGLV